MNPLSALVGRHIESGAREAVTSGPIPGLLRLGARGYGAMSGTHPLDRGALATAPVPVLGDAVGLAADARMFAQEPESRNPLNFGLAALGALPFVPALSTAKRMGGDMGGRVVFRGETGGKERIRGGIADGELFVADNESIAKLYGDRITKYEMAPGAKVLKEGTAEFAKVTGRRRGDLLRTLRSGENLRDAADSAAAAAKAAGYDAVEFSMKDLGIAVFNPSVLQKID